MSALTARVAKLDVDRVYYGMGDPVPVATLAPGDYVFCAPDVKLPDGVTRIAADCDLVPGRFRLCAPTKHEPFWHFLPLPPTLERAGDPSEINMDRALYEQLRHAHQVDPALVSPVAVQWATRFEQSFDKVINRALHYFRDWAPK